MSIPNHLFVYGTLAPGQSNEYWLEPLNGDWQPAWIYGELYPNGKGLSEGYPVVDIEGIGKVEGQLFSSDKLSELWFELDDFEGQGYQRILVDVYLLEQNLTVTAFVYAMNE